MLIGFATLWGAAPTPDWIITTWNIILVILGVNALIIVHEFGHFIVARMCGVRCDKFYIWFDINGWRFFRFKWGDTEYGLGVLPLGGYVKMFGQEDNPGQIAKEIESAKNAEKTANETEGNTQQSPDKEQLARMESALYAPDSYLSKSVPQRMAIISAGVIMNIIFAFICATAAFMFGVSETPCAIGSIMPGSPAWTEGLQVGDRIVKADGKELKKFEGLRDSLIEDKDFKGVKLEIKRSGIDQPIEKTLVARKEKTALIPTIGISPLQIPVLADRMPYYPSLKNQVPGKYLAKLHGKERLLSINGQSIEDFSDIVRIQTSGFDKTLVYEFERSEGSNSPGKTVQLSVPPIPMKEIGVRFAIGEITSIQTGTSAEKNGIAPGDTLLKVDEDDAFDPLKLPQILQAKMNAGQKEVKVSIKKKDGKIVDDILLTLNPIIEQQVNPNQMVACSSIGMAYKVSNTIAGVGPVESDSPKSPVGAVVEAIEFPDHVPAGLSGASFIHINRHWLIIKTGFSFVDVGNSVYVPWIFDGFLQGIPEETKVILHVSRPEEGDKNTEGMAKATEKYTFYVKESDDWFSADRSLGFDVESFLSRTRNPIEAAKLGMMQTIDGTLKVYQFLRNIGGNISAKAMGGPVTIVKVAYDSTSDGPGRFLLFLCLIGANLAVLNILPIPVLDGGHLVFLAYEGIFRKPPNESVQIILSYIGLFLLLGLMVWAISLDVGFISRF